MCERCDFCGAPGQDRCIKCDKCYCVLHKGRASYCYECSTSFAIFDCIRNRLIDQP